jgi:hypothetical protein
VKRERAVQLVEQMLARLDAGGAEWPLSIVTQLSLFGSFARGAVDPHDIDVAVEFDHLDDRWTSVFLQALSYGGSPYTPFRRALAGTSRSYELHFQAQNLPDVELTLLWRRGEPISTALDRLHALRVDPTAGRAPRAAMLPQFDGLDRWLPRAHREILADAVGREAITLERLVLADAPVRNPVAREYLEDRWKPGSPLRRAGQAVLTDIEQRGLDPTRVHLHGDDVDGSDTPYFAGLGLRYFKSIPWCLTRRGGVEWTEVVRPTRTMPLDALRITPLNKDLLDGADWS